MDDNQRLQLQNLIDANHVVDNTDSIRQLKHSHPLRKDVKTLLQLKSQFAHDETQLQLEAMLQCQFLCMCYTDIYNKIRKDEIDLDILFRALDVLQDIEDGRLDKHTGAFEFGKLLKEIYIDSALRKSEKLNAAADAAEPEYKGAQENITWTQFKRANGRLEHVTKTTCQKKNKRGKKK